MTEGQIPVQADVAHSPEGGPVSFGPFRLFPVARALEKDGVPLALGNRALDILTVLVEHAGEVVSHRDLIARVWRGLVVDPSNLRVHITGLRKALGDGAGDGKGRYIANVTGQGYCFVAPVRHETTSVQPTPTPEYPCGTARQRLVLPAVLARMVGRDDTVRTIVADLIADRFVTLIGPGGMGKTTVAVSVAHAMVEEFRGAVCFVDIGAVADPTLVAGTIASKLGLTVQTDDVVPALMLCVKTLRILLVLDNCEHLIEVVATLAERIFQEAPGVHILATSREALRVEGEHAHWLPPLESPPPDRSVSAAEALKFPAVKLFVERAAASGSRLELTDADAALVASICGRLDGMPLAIEFAAARVGVHGIAETANLLKNNLGLHWPGRRTALPRHQTLQSLLDWSYGLLGEPERRALRRLAIFVGSFTLEAAEAIACESASHQERVIDTVDALIAKSLVSFVISAGATRYRLLETTRVYALEKLEESGEKQAIAHRHAKYFASLLDSVASASSLSEHLGNVRAALEWAFSVDGAAFREPALAIDLVARSVPIFLQLSLLTECHKWSVAALGLLDETTRGGRQELVLQEARAITSSWSRGNGEDVRVAITRALAIAQQIGETSHRLRLLVGLHIFLLRVGEFRAALPVAEEFARSVQDESFAVIADCLLGSSWHFIGNQASAREHFERAFARAHPFEEPLFGLDYRVRALVTFARNLWLSGFATRAQRIAREALREAADSGIPLNVCFSYLYTVPLFMWCGDFGAARDALDRLLTHPNWHALPSLHATGNGLKGALLIRVGDAEAGTALLSAAVVTMRAERQVLLLSRAVCVLGEGLAAVGRHDEALAAVDEMMADTAEGLDSLDLPEMLRVRADILLSLPAPDEAGAEDCLARSLACSRRQSALAQELRAATTLARLRARQGRVGEAREVLSSVYGRFTEGFETLDLKQAAQLLEALGAQTA